MSFDIRRFSVHNSEENGKTDNNNSQSRFRGRPDRCFSQCNKWQKTEKADVSGMRKEAFEGRVPSISGTSMLSMSAQLAKGIDAIESINDKMDLILNKQDLTIEKLDQMLDKQDRIINKQDETNAEIRDLRDDMQHYSNIKRLKRMEKDIMLIKCRIGIKQN